MAVRPDKCPVCLSKFPEIHGVVFPHRNHEGFPCDDDWHKGPDYDPSKLNLSSEDKKFLAEKFIGF